MFNKLPLASIKQIIKLYNLETKIILSIVVNGKRRLKTKTELVKDLHEHLEIRKSDGEIIMKKIDLGKLDIYYGEDSDESEEEEEAEAEAPHQPQPQPIKGKERKKRVPAKKRVVKTPKPQAEAENGVEGAEPLIEPLVPIALVKEIKKDFDWILSLQKKGKNKKISKYSTSSILQAIICSLYLEKYKTAPIMPIDFNPGSTWNVKNFLQSLKVSIEHGYNTFCIPVLTHNHMNLLIIKVETREVIRFEPHGGKLHTPLEETDIDKEINDDLEDIVLKMNIYLKLITPMQETVPGKRKFIYYEPIDICPRINDRANTRGFQMMEERVKMDFGGLCQLWSMFFMECILKNPDLDIKDVYKNAYELMNDEPQYFKDLIVGYFININEEMKKMKGFIFKSIEKGDVDKYHEDYEKFYADYFKLLAKHREAVMKKPLKKFTGEGFIRPTLNKKLGKGASQSKKSKKGKKIEQVYEEIAPVTDPKILAKMYKSNKGQEVRGPAPPILRASKTGYKKQVQLEPITQTLAQTGYTKQGRGAFIRPTPGDM